MSDRPIEAGSEDAVQAILAAGREQVLESLERLDIDPLRLPRVPWDSLHEIIGAIWPTDIWLVGAGTGSGKTTLLAHLAEALLAARRRVYVITLEQKPSELRTAMAALALHMHPQRALENDWAGLGVDAEASLRDELTRQVQELEGRLIFSPSEVMREDTIEDEMRMADRFQADVVIIDHLGQVDAEGYGALKRFLKRLKREVNTFNLPVIVAAQLGRGDRDMMRPYRPPTTYDIEGGEVIAQIVSVALGLYRPLVDTFGIEDERAVRRGQAKIRDFLVPQTMGVAVLKHRARGDQRAATLHLGYRNGRIIDPTTAAREALESRYRM
jgi:replicative DNA helicase